MGGDMDLTLALKRFEFAPGDTVDVRLDVGTGGDKRLQAIRLELGYENTYYHRTRDSDGDSNDTRTSDDVVVAMKEMPADHPALSGGQATFETTLELPAYVPASVPKWVEWHVKAILDRKLRRDRREEVAITVSAPRPDAAGAQSPGSVGDKCDMRLEADSLVARPGDTLSGVLHVEPREAFEVRSVRADLECRMHHEDNIVRELGDDVEITLAKGVSFAAGVAQEFPFTITVPGTAAPTLAARHSSVRWELKGVCDRPRRGDYDAAAELVVYNA
jgi:Arrestin (or S-antigen), N-terminal domain